MINFCCSTVTLRGNSASFEEFLLQARVVGDASNKVVGTFISPPLHTKLSRCQADGDTVMHSDETSQTEVSVTWVAPSTKVGDIQFM